MTIGLHAFAAIDDVQGARVPLRALYPATAAPSIETFSGYDLDVAVDVPAVGERLPLCVVSHGTGGTPWGYRGLASHLARAGHAVVLVEHPGNSRGDNALADLPVNLENRPRHVRLAIDAAFADPVIGEHLMPDAAAVIGHSMGGYTALAVAGGHPMALPNQTPDRIAHPVPVEPDPRVRALVLLAPAVPWFMAPGALADVRVPMLVRTGELDEIAPPAFVERVMHGLAMDYAVVPGAHHFAFLAPFPAALARPDFAPSQDPPGFDRAGYHVRLYAEVLAFLTGAFPQCSMARSSPQRRV